MMDSSSMLTVIVGLIVGFLFVLIVLLGFAVGQLSREIAAVQSRLDESLGPDPDAAPKPPRRLGTRL